VKIVRIIARLNVGGPAIHVVLATQELGQRGNDCVLIVGPVPETEGSMEYYAAERGVRFIRVPQLVRPLSPWKDLVALWKIYRILRREKPDVVHTHTAKAGTVGRTAAVLAGVPVIVHTFHGNIFDGYFSPAKTRLFLFIERFLARFTDRIIAVSKSQRDELIDRYRIAPAEKFQIVRLGIDLGVLRALNVAGAHLTHADRDRPLMIGWVGRFVEVKDPLFFVDVAHALKSLGAHAKFVMVGDGPLRSAVEASIVEHGLQRDFTLTGWQRDMSSVYAGIDLMTLTSHNEGTPVAVIESMAAGLPFVALNVGGMSDLMTGAAQERQGFDVFENGIMVDSRDVVAFASAVSFLLQDASLREGMGQSGKEFALERFSKKRLVDDLEILYQKLAHSESPPEPAVPYRRSARPSAQGSHLGHDR
jgi:glycosyltransferase involved in cell wall biosynthesis